jgi:AraC family transcriptional activator FtrA
VEAMARHAGYSERSFARRFRAETGTTPLQWLIARRVSEAQRLLEGSDCGVEEVATRCGFGGAVALRQHFGRVVGTSPTAYRRTFRGAAA